MINKRLLVKNLLAHNDESSFYDKKQQLNLHTQEGKAKFLKHICALSNSNPANNSYLVIGVEDQNNIIIGDDFFDDSKIQNLVNAYLENPPEIQYDNIPFPVLPKDKVVGLVTIKPKAAISRFKKSIYTIPVDTTFIRLGSNSTPVWNPKSRTYANENIVGDIENNSRNSIEYTLDGVIDFVYHKHKGMQAEYKVFKELFVICWAGVSKKMEDKNYFSRVDIALINEQVKLFYSAQDVVTIEFDEDSFTITEYLPLDINGTNDLYPLEKQVIHFQENGYYTIDRIFLFQLPEFDKKSLFHIYNNNKAILEKLQKKQSLSDSENKDLENLPANFMICYLNGFEDAKQCLIDAKLLLKPYSSVYLSFKESLRILRKIKYNS